MNKGLLVLSILLGTDLIQTCLASSRGGIRQEIVDEIKRKTTSWVPMEAKDHPHRNKPASYFKKRLGLKSSYNLPIFDFIAKEPSVVTKASDKKKPLLKAIPSAFDSRTEWPGCIHDVRNQEDCGSCWAFASAGMLSDRLCIASGGAIDVVLSPQDLVACSFLDSACNGGLFETSLHHLMAEGAVSEGCIPYENKQTYCNFQCSNHNEKYEKYYCRKGSMALAVSNEDIQTEVMTNGPMIVGLVVYEDFDYYASGIYSHTTGEADGAHAIKLVGWGTDATEGLYWICENQWGTSWGESGYVNIKAGEVGIDTYAIACAAEVD